MQRRAVAVYVAIFLLLGTASYGLIATAETPGITIENPEYSLQESETISIDGTSYTASTIDTEQEEGSHGGGSHTVFVGELTSTEVQAQSDTWATDDVVELGERKWRVTVTDGSLRLVERQDRKNILQTDPTVRNETQQIDEQRYVVRPTEDGDPTLINATEYFDPEERIFAAGDTLEYRGADATVEEIGDDSGTVVWREAVEETHELNHESNMTIGSQEFFVYYPNGDQVYLTTDYASYDRQLQRIGTFNQRVDGLWRVFVLCLVSSGLMTAMAFLPSRY